MSTSNSKLSDFLDYAQCPRCECSTPIQRSRFSPKGEYQKWTKTDGVSEFFVCRQCNSIVAIPAQGLKPLEAIYESEVFRALQGTELVLYEQPTECDDEACRSPATLYIAWNSVGSGELNAEAARKWDSTDFVCPAGHRFRFRLQLKRK